MYSKTIEDYFEDHSDSEIEENANSFRAGDSLKALGKLYPENGKSNTADLDDKSTSRHGDYTGFPKCFLENMQLNLDGTGCGVDLSPTDDMLQCFLPQVLSQLIEKDVKNFLKSQNVCHAFAFIMIGEHSPINARGQAGRWHYHGYIEHASGRIINGILRILKHYGRAKTEFLSYVEPYFEYMMKSYVKNDTHELDLSEFVRKEHVIIMETLV